MRTRYLLVSALLLMLMVLPSCNQNLSPDRSASSLFITLPDNSKVRVDNAKYYKDMPDMQNCSCVLASVNDEKQYLYLSLSLIFDKDHLVVGQEMDFERFSFSIPISSDSHDYTYVQWPYLSGRINPFWHHTPNGKRKCYHWQRYLPVERTIGLPLVHLERNTKRAALPDGSFLFSVSGLF